MSAFNKINLNCKSKIKTSLHKADKKNWSYYNLLHINIYLDLTELEKQLLKHSENCFQFYSHAFSGPFPSTNFLTKHGCFMGVVWLKANPNKQKARKMWNSKFWKNFPIFHKIGTTLSMNPFKENLHYCGFRFRQQHNSSSRCSYNKTHCRLWYLFFHYFCNTLYIQ